MRYILTQNRQISTTIYDIANNYLISLPKQTKIAEQLQQNIAKQIIENERTKIKNYINNLEKQGLSEQAKIANGYFIDNSTIKLPELKKLVNNYLEEKNISLWEKTETLPTINYSNYPEYICNYDEINIYSTISINIKEYELAIRRYVKDFEEQKFLLWDDEKLCPIEINYPAQVAIEKTNTSEDFVAIVGMKEMFRKPVSNYMDNRTPGGGGGSIIIEQSRDNNSHKSSNYSKNIKSSIKDSITSTSLRPKTKAKNFNQQR